MEILVMSREQARLFEHDKPYAIIGINGTHNSEISYIYSDKMVTVLRVEFDDIMRPLKGMTLFNADIAEQIWKFVDWIHDEIDLLMVHCDSGISRSAAVAAAISKVYNGHCTKYFNWYCPNQHVYKTMLKNIPHETKKTKKLETIPVL